MKQRFAKWPEQRCARLQPWLAEMALRLDRARITDCAASRGGEIFLLYQLDL